ncbi:hypothetical protein M9458_038374, partial [Cirrhinus mrigala]
RVEVHIFSVTGNLKIFPPCTPVPVLFITAADLRPSVLRASRANRIETMGIIKTKI